MMKRSTAFIFAIILIVFSASGLSAAAQTPDPVKPVIRAEVNGKTFEGFAGSYCWPESGASQCAIVDDPQPPFNIPIKAGDKVAFTVDGGIKSLVTFKATLLDDTNTSGDPTLADLMDSSGVLPTDQLTDGAHRVQVDAIYAPNTDGSQNFVSYVFLLQIGDVATATVVAALPTKTNATAASTMEATEVTTSAATVEATATATSIVATPAATLQTTTAATTAVTSAVTKAATKVATRTATKAPTKAATAAQPPTIAPTATPTLIPTIEPTVEPTIAPTDSGPTVAPTLPFSDLAPAMTISVGGKSYQPIAVNACLQNPDGEQVCINRPVNANAKYAVSAPDSDSLIIFGGPRPTSELITLRNSDGTAIIAQQSVKPDNLALYTMPKKPGTYVLTVEVQWEKGKATYFFRVLVNG